MNNSSTPSLSKPVYPERHGYILHLWNSPGYWRASLENLETGRRSGFENLEKLFTYLMDLTEGRLQENTENERPDQSSSGSTSCGCSSAGSVHPK